ncbi:MAG: hypothetical protein ABDH32_07210 [Candidatus Caldarchaeales archaeon]
MGISAGLFSNTTLDLTEETDRNIQLLRGLLLIEAVNYTETDGVEHAEITVRNIAKQPIDLTITRIELLSAENVLYGSIPSTGFGNLTKLGIGNSSTLEAPTCPQCQRGDTLVYRVWYISSASYNEEQPLLSLNDMLYVEIKIVKPVGTVPPPICPLSQSWVLVDKVDPITDVEAGEIYSTNKIYVRPVFASQSGEVEIIVRAQEIVGGRQGSGSRIVTIPTHNDIPITGQYAGIKVPFLITVSSEWPMIQGSWLFDGIPRKIHVSGIHLQWFERDKNVYSVMIELGAGEEGIYRVSIVLRNCNKDILQSASSTINVMPGMYSITTFIGLSSPVSFDQIYYVETSIAEIG